MSWIHMMDAIFTKHSITTWLEQLSHSSFPAQHVRVPDIHQCVTGGCPQPRPQNESLLRLDSEAGGNISWWLYRHGDWYGRAVAYLTLLITCRRGCCVYSQQVGRRDPTSVAGPTSAAGCSPEDCCTFIKSCQSRVCLSWTSVFDVSADSQDVILSLSEL